MARDLFKQGGIPVAELNTSIGARPRSTCGTESAGQPSAETGQRVHREGRSPVKPADTTPKPENPAAAVTTPPGSAASGSGSPRRRSARSELIDAR